MPLTSTGRRLIFFLRATLSRWRAPKTAILMMQKDERNLLEFWFTYHADLIGPGNLFIFDNGSTDPVVIDTLNRIVNKGGHVIWEFDDPESYCNKGLVLLNKMKELREKGYRLFFPMDCDEFVAVRGEAGPSISRVDIRKELYRNLDFSVCQMEYCYSNHPQDPTLFKEVPHRKVLGRFQDIDWMGCGFHHVRRTMEPSNFLYFHYHNRPFKDLKDKAAAKIAAHGYDLSERSLAAFITSRENGWHSAKEYLTGESEYAAMHNSSNYEEYTGLYDWFLHHLERVPFQT